MDNFYGDGEGDPIAVIGVLIDYNERIRESDESNNYGVGLVYDQADREPGEPLEDYQLETDGADLAILANSLSVDHADLSSNQVVKLSATIWNMGDEIIPQGTDVRVWFREGSYSDGPAIDALGTPDYSDPSYRLIGYVDVEVPTGGLTAFDPAGDDGVLQETGKLDVEIEWIPELSASRTVCVLVQPLENGSDQQDVDLTNNVDEATFQFTSGDLTMTHQLAANGDLVFYLDYGDVCNNPSYGFGGYFRLDTGSGTEWVAMSTAPYGPGGGTTRCIFRIPRDEVWQMAAGTYQALGEVWYEDPNTGVRDFIDDEIVSFEVPSLGAVTAVNIAFVDEYGAENIPEIQNPPVAIADLDNLRVTVYYESNSATAPSYDIDFELVKVNDDTFVPFSSPVEGTSTGPSGSPATVTFSLSGATTQLLEEGVSYTVVVRVSGISGNDFVRRQMFTVLGADGFALLKKVVKHNGVQLGENDEVPARDGEIIEVILEVRRTGAVGP